MEAKRWEKEKRKLKKKKGKTKSATEEQSKYAPKMWNGKNN